MPKKLISEIDFTEIKKQFLIPAIKAELDRVIDEEIYKAEAQLIERLKEVAAGISVKIATMFDIERCGTRIIITFEDKSLKEK